MKKPQDKSRSKKFKPNWVLIIFIFIVLAFILGFVIETYVGRPVTKSISDFYRDVNLAAANQGDSIFFRSIVLDPTSNSLLVVFANVQNGSVVNEAYQVGLAGQSSFAALLNGVVPQAVVGTGAQIPSGTFQDYLIQNALVGGNGEIGVLNGTIIRPPSVTLRILTTIGPFLFLIFIFYLYFRFVVANSSGGAGGAFFNPGKNQAVVVKSNKTFKDVAGNQEAIEEVRELVDYLRYPKKYATAGARFPKGILLGGPPGTGKTLIAKATAGEANVPFFFISASNFVELYVGLGAKRVREMFKEARKEGRAIIFIDELDAIGRTRGGGIGGGNDEREQTLNQILVEMDGITENQGLLIIAATNRTDVLDPALLRPGRFDRIITVGLPDIKDREAILKLHAKGKRISSDIKFDNLAKRTPGFSGAQLENVINEASLLSVREKTDTIELDQIDEAIDRVMAGPAKKNRVITQEELTSIAYHEGGHAVVGIKIPGGNRVQKITIVPRGNAGGYNLMIPEKEKYTNSKVDLLSIIASFMGGRAAEAIIYGEDQVSTGAADDIAKATKIARKMVTEWGMSSLGPIQYEENSDNPFLGRDYTKANISNTVAHEIDLEVRKIITKALVIATKTINENLELLELIKEALLKKETIVAEEIEYISKNMKLPKSLENVNLEAKNKKMSSLDKLIHETAIVNEKEDKKEL